MSALRRHRTPIALFALAAVGILVVLLSSPGDSVRSGALHRTPATSAHDPRAAHTSRRGRPALLPSPPPVGQPAEVNIAAGPLGRAAPPDFLGLSFELRSLPSLARYATVPPGRPPAAGTPATGAANSAASDLVALLRSLGRGVLRFGGVSADEQAAWVEPGAALPAWASTAITPHDLAGIAALARETGWRVLLTVNLGHYDPRAAAQEAASAHAALGSALAGIEIGNEPDLFTGKRLRAGGWDFATYSHQASAYRTAIEAAVPGTPIAGPDPATGTSGLSWLRAAAHTLHPSLLTDHYYPLSSCGYRPTIGELLSPRLRAGTDQMLATMLAIARGVRSPLRIDETNSISCEGRRGVSDTFASALWALDYITRAIHAGAVGVNFHDLPSKPGSYSPLLAPTPAAFADGALHAQPEWYALLAARELPGSRPLPARVLGARAGELSASAFRTADGRVLLVLVDFDPPRSRPLAVRLRLPPSTASGGSTADPAARARAYARGGVLRLTAPSPAATGGVRLGGRLVAPDGSWTTPHALPTLHDHAGALSLQLAPSSAAVVTLYPR
jgi:hypothetical protein